MVLIFFRACMWTFRLEPLRKLNPEQPNHGKPNKCQLMSDAFDLICNLRGIGWSWSHGLRIPQETRDLASTPSFLFTTLVWFLRDIIASDFCHYIVQSFSPNTFGSPKGGTIFDLSLPPLSRYVYSTLITFFSGLTVYLSIDGVYHFATLIGIIVFQQSPTQWPPISEQPWRATSLNQFWARRWHQSFRSVFIGIGGKPLTYIAGRAGGVVGAFLVSGLLHDIGCWGMGRGTDFKSISGFFIMNAIGVIFEHLYKSITGKRVEGFTGWIWTFAWIVGWGSMLIDAWMSRGLAGSVFYPSSWRPSFLVLGPFLNNISQRDST